MYAKWLESAGGFEVTNALEWKDAISKIESGTADKTINYEIKIKGTVAIEDSSGGTINSEFVNISLLGEGASTLRLSSPTGYLLYIAQNQTIEVNNLTLQGKSNKNPLVYVLGGALCLNEGAKIVDNTNSTSDGGGVYVDSGKLTLEGGKISGNATTYSNSRGGGVYVVGKSTVIMDGTATIGGEGSALNQAPLGGGLYVDKGGSTVTMKGSASITGNKASSTGGGAWLGEGCVFTMEENASVSNNTNNNSSGAGLYVNIAIVTISGKAVLTQNTGANTGGAIYTTGASVITFSGEATLSANKAAWGAVLFAHASSTIIMKDSASASGNIATYGGGAINIASATTTPTGIIRTTLTMESGTSLKDNQVETASASAGYSTGGALRVEVGAEAIIKKGAVISGNTSAKYGGGVAVIGASFLTLEGGAVVENTANLSGGGIFADGNSTVKLTDGALVSGNTAKDTGGGVYITSTTTSFTVESGSIEHNKSAASGGGVYVNSGSFTIAERGRIACNTAAVKGGGVFVHNDAANTTFDKTGGVIYGYTPPEPAPGFSLYRSNDEGSGTDDPDDGKENPDNPDDPPAPPVVDSSNKAGDGSPGAGCAVYLNGTSTQKGKHRETDVLAEEVLKAVSNASKTWVYEPASLDASWVAN